MAERPKDLRTSQSFTRLESPPSKGRPSRSRASTLQGPVPDILDPLKERLIPESEEEHAEADVFAAQDGDEEDTGHEDNDPDSFEELPIEIRSVTERYSSNLVPLLKKCN